MQNWLTLGGRAATASPGTRQPAEMQAPGGCGSPTRTPLEWWGEWDTGETHCLDSGLNQSFWMSLPPWQLFRILCILPRLLIHIHSSPLYC